MLISPSETQSIPGIDLMLDAVAHRAADDAIELVGVHGLAPVLGEDEVDDLLGPGQAADVGGGDAGRGAHGPHPTAACPSDWASSRRGRPTPDRRGRAGTSASSRWACSHHAASSMRNGCMTTVCTPVPSSAPAPGARRPRPRRRARRVPATGPQRREALHQVVGVDELPVERHPGEAVADRRRFLARRRAPGKPLGAQQRRRARGELAAGRPKAPDVQAGGGEGPGGRARAGRAPRRRRARPIARAASRGPRARGRAPRSRRAASGLSSQLIASTKNVARRPLWSSASSSRGRARVTEGSSPSGSVRVPRAALERARLAEVVEGEHDRALPSVGPVAVGHLTMSPRAGRSSSTHWDRSTMFDDRRT